MGLLITVLVLIGFITVLRAGVGLVANLFDDTAQKQEYEDKLEGLVLFDPMPFDGIENIDDLTLREAAVWGCVYSIQETQGGFENYNTDPETEQLLLPSVEVDAYLASCWAPASADHRSFDMEDMTVELDETTQCYKKNWHPHCQRQMMKHYQPRHPTSICGLPVRAPERSWYLTGLTESGRNPKAQQGTKPRSRSLWQKAMCRTPFWQLPETLLVADPVFAASGYSAGKRRQKRAR